jgi:hypothetical protein
MMVVPILDETVTACAKRSKEESSFLKKRSKRLLCPGWFHVGGFAAIVPQAKE